MKLLFITECSGQIDDVCSFQQVMQGTNVHTAFVSTNSITQGEQVASVWKPLFDRFGIHIDFAHRTFRWDSEASLKAHVHCVIIGFSTPPRMEKLPAINVGKRSHTVANINAYLMDAPNLFISSRRTPICDVPPMSTGNRPADGGNLIIENSDYEDFIRKEPKSIPYIKRLIGSVEFINNKKRWCLWLVGVTPAELRRMPEVLKEGRTLQKSS